MTAFGASKITETAQKAPTIVFTATNDYVGTLAVNVMNILIISSAFAAILAFHNAGNRYFYALGRERVLPAVFGSIHPRTRSPWVAGAVSTVLAVIVVIAFALAGLDPFVNLLIWLNSPGVIGIMLLQALCSFAVVARKGRIV